MVAKATMYMVPAGTIVLQTLGKKFALSEFMPKESLALFRAADAAGIPCRENAIVDDYNCQLCKLRL